MEMDMKEQRRQGPMKAIDEVAVDGSSPDNRSEKQKARSGRVCRARDIVFSAFALVILSPVILIFALLVVLDSPGAGPVYVQERIGKDEKPFRFYNLRCMENMRRMNEILERIRAYICAIQTTDFLNAHFRHQNGSFSAVVGG